MYECTRIDRTGRSGPSDRGSRRGREAGFGLIDSMISIVVIAVSTVGFLSASVTSMSLEKENRTVAAANEMSRAVVEEMLALPIAEVLPTYNASHADDPGGAGTARGSSWSIDTTAVLLAMDDATTSADSSGSGRTGLLGGALDTTQAILQQTTQTTTSTTRSARIATAEAMEVPKTMDCHVQLPTTTDATGNEVLREDTIAPEYGLPCDLNGDGVIDGKNHAADYKVLPMVIRLDWPTVDGGTHSVTFTTVIGGGRAQ
jgi:Tfp pilus assembly protein PilV